MPSSFTAQLILALLLAGCVTPVTAQDAQQAVEADSGGSCGQDSLDGSPHQVTAPCRACIEERCSAEAEGAYGQSWASGDMTQFGGVCGPFFDCYCTCVDVEDASAQCIWECGEDAGYYECIESADAYDACRDEHCSESCGAAVES